MRRDQLEHAIRTACQILGHDAVVVVGSQSILGSFAEDDLPVEATMSTEIDILPLGKDALDTARLADVIEGVDAGAITRRLSEVPEKHRRAAEGARAWLQTRS
jgi:hypothetical protein